MQVTSLQVTVDFSHLLKETLNGKTHFLCSEIYVNKRNFLITSPYFSSPIENRVNKKKQHFQIARN